MGAFISLRGVPGALQTIISQPCDAIQTQPSQGSTAGAAFSSPQQVTDPLIWLVCVSRNSRVPLCTATATYCRDKLRARCIANQSAIQDRNLALSSSSYSRLRNTLACTRTANGMRLSSHLEVCRQCKPALCAACDRGLPDLSASATVNADNVATMRAAKGIPPAHMHLMQMSSSSA